MIRLENPRLCVISSLANLQSHENRNGTAFVALTEGILVSTSGDRHQLWSRIDDESAFELAQRVSEYPWTLISHFPEGSESWLAAVVAGSSKLDVYQDFCKSFRTELIVSRAINQTQAVTVDWRAAEKPPQVVIQNLPLLARISVQLRTTLQATKMPGGLLAWLKRNKWEWTARSISDLITARHERRFERPLVDVLGIFDVRNAGMVANVTTALDALQSQGVRTSGVAMHSAVRDMAHASLASDTPMFSHVSFMRPKDLLAAFRRLTRVRRGLRSYPDALALEPAAQRAAQLAYRALHSGYILQTLVDFRTMERMLSHLQPTVAVVASDAHRYARVLVAAANTRGVDSVVLQHGALVKGDFYTPVVASHMLAWGPWCERWFQQNGTPDGKVTAVGYLRGESRTPIQALYPDNSSPRLLFAAQPVPNQVTRELLDMVKAALLSTQEIRLTIRPHPGEGRRHELSSMLEDWPASLLSRVEVSPVGQSLDTDLEHCDAAIMTQSTVGIDALSAGLPVLLIRHGAIREMIPFLEYKAVIEVNSADDILHGIELLKDREYVNLLGERVSVFLDEYIGTSGKQARSIAAGLIKDLIGYPLQSADTGNQN